MKSSIRDKIERTDVRKIKKNTDYPGYLKKEK